LALDSRYGLRPYNGFEIDLSSSEDRILSKMAPPCRRCINKATRCGVSIEEANDAGFADDFYQQLEDVFAKQGLRPTYGKERVSALIDHLHPTGNLLLLRAFDTERRCIATGIFPAMHDRAYFWGGASWREHQHLRPNELVFWYAMRYWKARGVRYLDMGGGGEYKRKYGGREISVPWLRTSRFPIVPLLRDGAMVIVKARQRWQGTWHVGAAAGARG
jgi:predicted N-acyltransferase